MTGATHILVGIAGALAYGHSVGAEPLVMMGMAALGAIGGALPDIDHPQSLITGWIPPARAISLFVRHRGITHSVWVWGVISFLAFYWLGALYGGAVALGYGLHIVADCMTPAGVRIMGIGAPLRLAPRWVGRAGVMELIVELVALGGILWIALAKISPLG